MKRIPPPSELGKPVKTFDETFSAEELILEQLRAGNKMAREVAKERGYKLHPKLAQKSLTNGHPSPSGPSALTLPAREPEDTGAAVHEDKGAAAPSSLETPK